MANLAISKIIKKKLKNDWNPGALVLIVLSNEYQYDRDYWSTMDL